MGGLLAYYLVCNTMVLKTTSNPHLVWFTLEERAVQCFNAVNPKIFFFLGVCADFLSQTSIYKVQHVGFVVYNLLAMDVERFLAKNFPFSGSTSSVTVAFKFRIAECNGISFTSLCSC